MTLAASFSPRLRRRASEAVCDRRSGQMVQREFIETRQVDIDFMETHFHVGKPRLRCEALQVLFGWVLPRRAEADGGFGRYEASERVADGFMICPGALPHAERKTAADGRARGASPAVRAPCRERTGVPADTEPHRSSHPPTAGRTHCARAIPSVRRSEQEAS